MLFHALLAKTGGRCIGVNFRQQRERCVYGNCKSVSRIKYGMTLFF